MVKSSILQNLTALFTLMIYLRAGVMRQTSKTYLKKLSFFAITLVLCISANAQFTADFSMDKTEGCAPLVVKLTDLSTAGANDWDWSTDAGYSSELQNPVMIFPKPGVFTITLESSNGVDTDTEIKQAVVRVLPGLEVNFSASKLQDCVPFTTQFNDLSVPQSAAITQWFWSFGNGETSTEQNPSVTYTKGKVNDVLLKATDANGCEASVLKKGFIEAGEPKANFLFDSVACSLPADVFFLNTSEGENLQYEWDFGNGQTSSGSVPGSITYSGYDTLDVTLIINEPNTGCSDTTTKKLYLYDYPVNFTVDFNCSDTNFTAILTETSDPQPSSLSWDLGDGTISSSQAFSHEYSNTKERTITLTAELGSSCKKTKSFTYAPPNALFTTDIPITCDTPFVVDFLDASTGQGLSHHWNFGDDDSSSTSNPQHNYAFPPFKYTATLNVTDSFGCVANRWTTIDVKIPKADILVSSGSNMGCAPFSANFEDSIISLPSPIAKWEWNFGDPASGSLNFSTDSNPSHVFQEAGTYDIQLALTLQNGCIDTITKKSFIRVGTPPDDLDFNINFSDTVCFNNSLDFEGLATYNNPSYYSDYFCWAFEEEQSNLLQGNETPPIDCPSSISAYQPLDKYVNTQVPTHVFGNYTLGASKLVDGIKYSDVFTPDTGEMYVHLISGFNGCYSEIQKKVFVKPTIAKIGFGFSSSEKQSLIACDTARTIGLFNHSQGYDTLHFFHVIHQETGDTVLKINNNDTTFYKFNKRGTYKIELEVGNKKNDCVNRTSQQFTFLDYKPAILLPDTVCTNELVYISDTSSYAPGRLTARAWQIDLNVVEIVEELYPRNDTLEHSFETGGKHKVVLWHTVEIPDNYGSPGSLEYSSCFYQPSDSIYVHGNSVVPLIDTNLTCTKENIFLSHSSTSTTAINKTEWFLKDSTDLLSTNDQFTYAQTVPGTYIFKLVIENAFGCRDSAYSENWTNSRPIIYVETTDSVICEGDLAIFKNKSVGNNPVYNWVIESSEYSNIDANHLFSGAGKYSVYLKATDEYGCADSSTFNEIIRVSKKPDATFKAESIVLDCPPRSVQFNDTSATEGNKWFWNTSDGGSSNTKNFLHTFVFAGSYDVEFTSINEDGCSYSNLKLDYITVKGPKASFASNPNQICAPDTASFISTFQDTKYFVWDFADGTIEPFTVSQSKDTATHIYRSSGSYIPVLTVIDSNDCAVKYVRPDPILVNKITAEIEPTDTIACSLDSIVFNNNTTSFVPCSYDWNFGNGISSSDSVGIVSYSSENNFTIKLIASDALNCSDTAEIVYQVFRGPKEEMVIDAEEFCIPELIEFNLQIGDSLFTEETKTLLINGTTYNSFKEQVAFEQTGSYDIGYTLSYGNGNCIVDSSWTIQLFPVPIAAFSYSPEFNSAKNDAVYFSNNSANSGSYQWDFGNGSKSNAVNPVHTYNSSDLYKVQLIASNDGGCADTAYQQVPIAPYNLIQLPNAFSPDGDGYNDEFGILYAGNMGLISFEIYNRWGNLLFKTNDINKKWDGYYKEQLQSHGTYIYYIKGSTPEGKLAEYKGNFTLIR